MANRGYDVVVDVDAEVQCSLRTWKWRKTKALEQGDLGHTDLQEDNLEFHSSSMGIMAPRSLLFSLLTHLQTLTPTSPAQRSNPTPTPVSCLGQQLVAPVRARRSTSCGLYPSTPSSSTSIRTRFSGGAMPRYSPAQTSSMSSTAILTSTARSGSQRRW